MKPELLAVRRRLFEDFEFYAGNAVTIRTKKQELINLRLNRAQRHLLERCYRQLERRGYIRIIILKGRQMGSSTFVEAFLYWWVSQRKAQKALVVAHDIPATTTIFEMTKRLHDNCPEILRPATRNSGRRELHFGALDSGYRIATAGGDGIVRGDTITAGHLSEAAWWPPGSARANYSGLMDAIPSGESAPGTVVFEESTANGFNMFWEHWDAAIKGESDFEAVFLPWFWDDAYRSPVPADFERTPGEEELVRLYDLDDEQLMFRRLKIAEKGADLFRQEYPCCADEAFLTSGRPVFNPDRVAEMLLGKREPIARKSLSGVVVDNKRKLVWEDNPLGELLCYLPHDPHETYYIGCDVGAGVRKDSSVAQVLDSKRRQAACWKSDRYDPDYFGTVIAHLGRFYNDAQIICERNNHGILTNRVLTKDEEYPYVFRETVYDKVTDEEREEIGFFTSEKSKPLIIDKLRAEVRDRTVEVYDADTLHEMQQFIVTETGRMEAEKGHHDDHVLAMAMANHINEGAWTPVTNMDSWYGEIE